MPGPATPLQRSHRLRLRRSFEELICLAILLGLTALLFRYAPGALDDARRTEGWSLGSVLRIDLIEHYALIGDWPDTLGSDARLTTRDQRGRSDALAMLTHTALFRRADGDSSTEYDGSSSGQIAFAGISGGTIFMVSAMPLQDQPGLLAMRPATASDYLSPTVQWWCDADPRGYPLTRTSTELIARATARGLMQPC